LNNEAMVTHASSVVRCASPTSKQNQGLDASLAWQTGPAADRRIGGDPGDGLITPPQIEALLEDAGLSGFTVT
jgi:hypothetical protein